MAYIKLSDDGAIEQAANWQFPGSVPAKESVVRDEEGQLVYKSALNEAHEQAIREQLARDAKKHEIIASLDALDAKGARAARALALAVAKGEQVNAADMEKLALIEEAAQALRAEMGAL